MQIKIRNKLIYTYSAKRLLYTLCFFFFCVIEQRVKNVSWIGGWPDVFRDLTGVVMAVVIMSHYRLKEFRERKLPYLVWTVLWIIGAPFVFFWGKHNWTFLNDWLVLMLNGVLYGYILIHTFISVVLEKRWPRLNVRYFAVWLLMMALMIVSRSNYIWPFCYLVMFGCFYLTDYSKEEQKDLFQGMLDGMILGFYVIQGLCFVFRPYDEVRYKGMFANPNWNALFYLEVLAAVFAKLLYVTRTKAAKWVRAYYWIGAGVVLSFELLTIGRAGWLTAMVMILAFLKYLGKLQTPRRWGRTLLTMTMCVILTFPLCFAAVRYVPPLFHHPLWYQGEWNEERVHSWDPWNSEKFVDIDEYLEAALGRIGDSFINLFEHSPFMLKADAAEAGEDMDVEQDELPPNKIPVLTEEQARDAFLVRSTIYQYYFRHLNLFGHTEEEQGFQLKEHYWIGHAHNIFLQYGTDFGIPVMVLLAVLVVWGAVLLGKRYAKSGTEAEVGCWMYLLIPAVFGMFEYSWGVGSLSMLMMFVAWREVFCCEE